MHLYLVFEEPKESTRPEKPSGVQKKGCGFDIMAGGNDSQLKYETMVSQLHIGGLPGKTGHQGIRQWGGLMVIFLQYTEKGGNVSLRLYICMYRNSSKKIFFQKKIRKQTK